MHVRARLADTRSPCWKMFQGILACFSSEPLKQCPDNPNCYLQRHDCLQAGEGKASLCHTWHHIVLCEGQASQVVRLYQSAGYSPHHHQTAWVYRCRSCTMPSLLNCVAAVDICAFNASSSLAGSDSSLVRKYVRNAHFCQLFPYPASMAGSALVVE